MDQNSCRLCLKKARGLFVNVLRIPELCKTVETFLNFQILSTDQCSTRICPDCITTITEALSFKNRVSYNQQSIKEQLLLQSQIQSVTVKCEDDDDDDVIEVFLPLSTPEEQVVQVSSTQHAKITTTIRARQTARKSTTHINKESLKAKTKRLCPHRLGIPLGHLTEENVKNVCLSPRTKHILRLKGKIKSERKVRKSEPEILQQDIYSTRLITKFPFLCAKTKANEKDINSRKKTTTSTASPNPVKMKNINDEQVKANEKDINSRKKTTTASPNPVKTKNINDEQVKANEKDINSRKKTTTASPNPVKTTNINDEQVIFSVRSPNRLTPYRSLSSFTKEEAKRTPDINLMNEMNIYRESPLRFALSNTMQKPTNSSTNSVPASPNIFSSTPISGSKIAISSSSNSNIAMSNVTSNSNSVVSRSNISANTPMSILKDAITSSSVSGSKTAISSSSFSNTAMSNVTSNSSSVVSRSNISANTPMSTFKDPITSSSVSVTTMSNISARPKMASSSISITPIPNIHQTMTNIYSSAPAASMKPNLMISGVYSNVMPNGFPITMIPYSNLPATDIVMNNNPTTSLANTSSSNSNRNVAQLNSQSTSSVKFKVLSVNELNTRGGGGGGLDQSPNFSAFSSSSGPSPRLPIKILLTKVRDEMVIKLYDTQNNDVPYIGLNEAEKAAIRSSLLSKESRKQFNQAFRASRPDRCTLILLNVLGLSIDTFLNLPTESLF